jgi:hypothetical protein
MNLGQAAKEQVYLIECRACKHHAQVNLVAMAASLGESFPLADLRPRLRCSECGSRNTISTTLWKSSSATEQSVQRFLGKDQPAPVPPRQL